MQSNGLVRSYRENEAVHKYLRQLMALPFLPAVQIPEAFDSMKPRADRLPGLISMVQYIDRQWIHNPVFHVHEWSVFRHSIRTNNDVEGWLYSIFKYYTQSAQELVNLGPPAKNHLNGISLEVRWRTAIRCTCIRSI